MTDTLLRATNISKSFGGLQALKNVSFEMPNNCIYGIIGPNGAGKSSLFNVLTGLYQADSGELLFNNKNILNQAPHLIVQQGIARTFQNIRLFASMSALENVMVGCHTQSHTQVLGAVLRDSKTRREEKKIKEKSQALLHYVGLGNAANNKLARELSYGDQRRLEIARALASEPRLLALDEPAAGMNPAETRQLQELLQRLQQDGISILLIEHDVKFVMHLCKRILVLDYGLCIAEDAPELIRKNPHVIEAYLGIAP